MEDPDADTSDQELPENLEETDDPRNIVSTDTDSGEDSEPERAVEGDIELEEVKSDPTLHAPRTRRVPTRRSTT